MSDTTLSNVFWGHSAGVLVLSASGLLWRSRTTESQKKLLKDDITHHLKVYQKGGKYVRFTGLKAQDVAQLKNHVESHFDRELEQEKVAAGGGNWGEMKFEGPNLNFRTANASVMELPLEQISQCAYPFHEDDTVAGDEETLSRCDCTCPRGRGGRGCDGRGLPSGGVEKANIRSVMGKSIVDLDETIGLSSPLIYGSFLRMHGKTFDYKIMYSNINRCFLLELPNGINTAFVISLEEPIRQGKQGYPHLVLQLSKNDVHIDVNMSSEEIKKYNGNIHERMSGALPQIVATLFKFIIGKKVYTSGKFKTHSGDRAVKCAVKAQSGVLFPLEKSFMFIHKPTTFIRYEEIDYIEFQRYAGQSGSSASRNFDLLVSCKSYIFSAIDRREFPELSQFLTSKKLRIRNLKESHAAGAQPGSKKRDFNEYLEELGPEEGEIEDDEDEEDSDFGPGDASGSESSDFSDEELRGGGGGKASKKDKKKKKKKSHKKHKSNDEE
ncbi:SSRP1 domain [Phytophthora cactorum]|nr:SSRP1 domain [Phytophthora cactorum]